VSQPGEQAREIHDADWRMFTVHTRAALRVRARIITPSHSNAATLDDFSQIILTPWLEEKI